MTTTILAIDTTSEAVSVALLLGGACYERYQYAPQQQSALVLPMIEDLVKSANLRLSDLDAIAVGAGPGSFTGVRLSVTVAQGLAFGLNKPVIPISTLQALAQQAIRRLGATQCYSAIDARMKELYVGYYESNADGLAVPLWPDKLIAQTDSHLDMPAGCGVGTGWLYLSKQYPDMLAYATWVPRAKDIAYLALDRFKQNDMIVSGDLKPIYLRNMVATPSVPKT